MKVLWKQPQYTSLLKKVFIFSAIWFIWQNVLVKWNIFAIYCCKHEGLISSIVASWYWIFTSVVIIIIAEEGCRHILDDACM